MTKDEALKLALEALEESWHLTPKPDYVRATITAIKEALTQQEQVREKAQAEEREACAKLAAKTVCDVHIPSGVKIYGTVAAKAIRERGQA